MMKLYEDSAFTFRFAESRIIARFHLEGIEQGRRVRIFRVGNAVEPTYYAEAAVGEAGWVELREPIIVAPETGFIVVPEPTCVVD